MTTELKVLDISFTSDTVKNIFLDQALQWRLKYGVNGYKLNYSQISERYRERNPIENRETFYYE